MNRPLLDRRQLEQRNRSSLRYPLGIAEKDYFLAVALSIIYASPLKDKLVFKGGTALHHCYLPQYRFSEDLDFTASDKNLQMEEIGGVLEDSGIFRVRKQRQSSHTIKLDRLQYSGVLGQPGNIKVEIDTTQNVVQEVFARTYANVWGMEIQPYTMDVVEICAEKIRATSGRARYRDFYDLYLLLTELGVTLAEALQLVRVKEVREPISQSSMILNWQVAKEDQDREIPIIFCKKEIDSKKIDRLLAGIEFDPIT